MAPVLAFFKEFLESRVATLCLVMTLFFVGCAALAPAIAPINPYNLAGLNLNDASLPPGTTQTEDIPPIRISVHAEGGAAQIEEEAADGAQVAVTLAPRGDALALQIDAPDLDIETISLNSLPIDASVEGARKHPIRSEWTLENLEGPIIIETGGTIPQVLTFSLELQAAADETGMTFALGTDGFGRDLLSAIIYGIRISIIVGIIGAIGSMAVGSMLGLAAAWFGGRVDSFIMRIVDFQLSIPSLMVGLLVLTVLGKGVDKILFAIILVQWTTFARTTRSVALTELRKDYVEAARCLRFSALRINLRHILPNCLPPLLVLLTINIASAITLEASLSFLGVGLPLTQPSLGMMISNGYEYMFSNMYWIAIYPGIVLMVMVISINVVGDRLRDMLNPQLKR